MSAKKTLNITCAELKMMFSTPVAWMMLIVFTILCSLFFTDTMKLFAEAQESGSGMRFITNSLFASDSLGVFNKVKTYLFLFIPLVTMGMLSRETSSGTARLLWSSPVTDTEIVIGKYLALAAYSLALMASIGLIIIAAVFSIENPDIPFVLTGLLGLFLLSLTYCAVGLFVSSLTDYQVVAALVTFAILALLSYVGKIAQDVVWMRDVTYWLSISGRCSEFIGGLICSEDVTYFVFISAFFLALTVLRLKWRRTHPSAGKRVVTCAALMSALVLVALISSRPALMFYHDSTETKMMSLTPESQEVMSRIKGRVDITTYANILDEDCFYIGVPDRYNDDKKYIRQYLRYKPDTRLKYVYYWTDCGNKAIARRFHNLTNEERVVTIADIYGMNPKMFMGPEKISSIIDLSGEKFRLVRQLKAENGNESFLRIYDDSERLPKEKEITAAFKRLVDEPVRVTFLSGNGERDIFAAGDRGYNMFATAGTFRHSLINNGFEVTTTDLTKGESIPEDTDILVIADPRKEYGDAALQSIEEYIRSGRNLVLAAEPDRAEATQAVAAMFGVVYGKGRVVAPAGDNPQNLVTARFTNEASRKIPSLSAMRHHNYEITMPDALSLMVMADSKGFSRFNFLYSPKDCWEELGTTDFENEVAEMGPGEKAGNKAVSIELSRTSPADSSKTQKVIVLGDADCFSNGELMRDRYAIQSGNFTLLCEMFRYLSDGRYPVNVSRPSGSDNNIRISVGQANLLKWILVGIIPMLLLVISVLTVAGRKTR